MANNNRKKYKLMFQLTTAVVATSLAAVLSTCSAPSIDENIPFTQVDNVSNLTFNEELMSILEENSIIFKNAELYNLIASQIDGELTHANLKQITNLEITKPLENTDLSDLKYLPNLNYLRILDNPVNFEDIKYNQDLYILSLENCTIKNTTCIPNSTNSIFLNNCTSEDQTFIVPYYTTYLNIFDTELNNILLKNPSSLETFCLVGNSYINLSNFKECINLKELEIRLCANIKEASTLKDLPNIKTITLDDYAAIWLDIDTLLSLPVSEEDKYILYDEISKLDEIASSLSNGEELSDEEKIARISSYILSSLNYNEAIASNEAKHSEEIADYNNNPINYALNKDEVICINYACLFTALANRLNLDSYQLFSTNHTWNIIAGADDYKGYDLTYLDAGPIVELEDGSLALVADMTSESIIEIGKGELLQYYEFNIDDLLDEDHQTDFTPTKVENIIHSIGYINDNSLLKVVAKNEIKIYKLTKFIKIELTILLLAIAIKLASKIKKQIRLTKEKGKLT